MGSLKLQNIRQVLRKIVFKTADVKATEPEMYFRLSKKGTYKMHFFKVDKETKTNYSIH